MENTIKSLEKSSEEIKEGLENISKMMSEVILPYFEEKSIIKEEKEEEVAENPQSSTKFSQDEPNESSCSISSDTMTMPPHEDVRCVSQHINHLINADISEVKQFRSRISGDPSFVVQFPDCPSGAKSMNEFDDLEVKTLKDDQCLENCSHGVFGRLSPWNVIMVSGIMVLARFVLKKVTAFAPRKFRCDKCKKNYGYAVKRFRSSRGFQASFLTPDLSNLTNDTHAEWIVEGTVKRCLDLEFDSCVEVNDGQAKKKLKDNVDE
ncbi:hypothetical protein SASPL_143868 [Salvia splendens]|uniref:Uncharacterized protein n=1 Tax=Salvia splendens TaxID=180675 RepID=A0A8X8WP58_SALSN|nr:hypothetical protein SASPL_143868 [Salvia splendens]